MFAVVKPDDESPVAAAVVGYVCDVTHQVITTCRLRLCSGNIHYVLGPCSILDQPNRCTAACGVLFLVTVVASVRACSPLAAICRGFVFIVVVRLDHVCSMSSTC